MIDSRRIIVPETRKARVFMSGRSQHVTIPREYRFRTNEVSIRRDPKTGDVILTEGPGSWDEVLAVLDADPIPEDFLSGSERDHRPPQVRPALEALFDGGETVNKEK
jgi:antitoxin VapB